MIVIAIVSAVASSSLAEDWSNSHSRRLVERCVRACAECNTEFDVEGPWLMMGEVIDGMRPATEEQKAGGTLSERNARRRVSVDYSHGSFELRLLASEPSESVVERWRWTGEKGYVVGYGLADGQIAPGVDVGAGIVVYKRMHPELNDQRFVHVFLGVDDWASEPSLLSRSLLEFLDESQIELTHDPGSSEHQIVASFRQSRNGISVEQRMTLVVREKPEPHIVSLKSELFNGRSDDVELTLQGTTSAVSTDWQPFDGVLIPRRMYVWRTRASTRVEMPAEYVEYTRLAVAPLSKEVVMDLARPPQLPSGRVFVKDNSLQLHYVVGDHWIQVDGMHYETEEPINELLDAKAWARLAATLNHDADGSDVPGGSERMPGIR